ncbi:hypothetical protein BDR26DRAFT_850990 [Obelidium mucronatum]|nr:hypothetical protein BDR26DRAFT_850990 [Obelidium mucronatum]
MQTSTHTMMAPSCCFVSSTSQHSQWMYWLNVSIATPFNSVDLIISPPEGSGSFVFSSPIAVVGNAKNPPPAACRPTTLLGNGSEWICDMTQANSAIAFLIDSSGAYPPNSVPILQSVASFQDNGTLNSPSSMPSSSIACVQAEPNAKCPSIPPISHDTNPSTSPTASASSSNLSPGTVTTISIVAGVSVAAVLIVGFMRIRNREWFKSFLSKFSNEDEPRQPVAQQSTHGNATIQVSPPSSLNASSKSSPSPSVGIAPRSPKLLHSQGSNQIYSQNITLERKRVDQGARKMPVNPLAFNRHSISGMQIGNMSNSTSRKRNSSPNSTMQSSIMLFAPKGVGDTTRDVDDDDDVPLQAIVRK